MKMQKKSFTVVMRAPSSVVFWESDSLRIDNFQSSEGPVTITYKTRWIKKTEHVVLPGMLWIEVQGSGAALEDVLVPFANAALIILPLLSFSANAAIGHAEIELGFESTPGITSRDYFQSYIPPESGVAHVGRRIDVTTTGELLRAVNQNPESERILRAISQYRLALNSWRLGNESLSLAHLWMALEAITKSVIRSQCAKHSCDSEASLAEIYDIEIKELDSYVRKNMILRGDEECYKKGKKASDGLEHGFLGFDVIRSYAKDIRHRMADHIRHGIFYLLDEFDSNLEIIKLSPFDEPMGNWPLAKYLRGKLLGDSYIIAREGNAYPFMKWNPVITSCTPNAEGKVTYQYTESITPELADGISFQPSTIEVWQPD